VIYFCESVEVLYNLSLNYNEIRSYNLRELLRVGRRYDVPAFLKRSAKAVHLEGCGRFCYLAVCPLPESKII
jgi:hypothetical protein